MRLFSGSNPEPVAGIFRCQDGSFRFTRGLVMLGLLTILTIVSLFNISPVSAEGSRDLFPGNGTCNATAPQPTDRCRSFLEWRNDSYGPAGSSIKRRSLLKAYAAAGEYILVGSSAMGVPSNPAGTVGDIYIYTPAQLPNVAPFGNENVPDPATNLSVFRCSSLPAGSGVITTRAEELAGPRAITGGGNPTGYVPCFFQAPANGIYSIVMTGPLGFNDSLQAVTPNTGVSENTIDITSTQNTAVSAWDVTVRANNTSVTDLNGRAFSYALALFTGNNGRPVDYSMYVVTTDGYRYSTAMKSLDPNGYLIYGNLQGYFDSDGATPLYHDVQGNDNQLTSVIGGVSFAPPQFPQFFHQLTTTTEPTLTALGIPQIAVDPTVAAFSFTGTANANTSYFGSGGTFRYTSNIAGGFEIVISRDGVNFDPANPQNRVLRGLRGAGNNIVTWDGRDNSGVFFPVGNNYQVRASTHAGEYHFPVLDAENNPLSGPSFTLSNPPAAGCPTLSNGCSTGFYDDRGYTTLSGASVGTPNQVLCGVNPPSVPVSLTGYNTITNNQRAYGNLTLFNGTTNCNGPFGDRKGLDVWIYYPSTQVSTPLNIIAAPQVADVQVQKTASTITVTQDQIVNFTVTVTNLGPGQATGVFVTDQLPAGLEYVAHGTSQGNYDPNTGIWNVGDLLPGRVVTLQIAARVTQCITLTNTATKTGQNETDPNPANDKASVTITCTGAPTPTPVVTPPPTTPAPPQPTDPVIKKTADKSVAKPGETVNYTIVINNPGTSPATDVVMTDSVPSPFVVQGVTTTQGTASHNGQDVRVEIGTLAPGASVTMVITTVIAEGASGAYDNTAFFTGLVDGRNVGGSSTATVTIPVDDSSSVTPGPTPPGGSDPNNPNLPGLPNTGRTVETEDGGAPAWLLLGLVMVVLVSGGMLFARRAKRS